MHFDEVVIASYAFFLTQYLPLIKVFVFFFKCVDVLFILVEKLVSLLFVMTRISRQSFDDRVSV